MSMSQRVMCALLLAAALALMVTGPDENPLESAAAEAGRSLEAVRRALGR